jgi:DNA repair photolyase
MARSSAAVKRPPAPKALLPKALSPKASSTKASSTLAASPKALSPKAVSPTPSLPEASAPAGDLVQGGPVQRGRQRPGATPPRPAAADLAAPTDGEVAVEDTRRHGRGAQSNASGRFEPLARTSFDDGWQRFEELPPFKTTVTIDATRKIITRNDSPDISFDRSINPYRGCEHGCIYCFARPTHAYLGLSPGLDFESKLFAKPEAAKLLERELSAAGYVPRTIAIGTNTDPYQPIEREHLIMRRILEVLDRFGHPVGIVTKSALVLRDLDILAGMAKRNLVKVALSVTTLDPKLARVMEPRAATPPLRLDALRQLTAAGVPTSVMVAPVIPALNDSEIERILDAAAAVGVKEAGYVLLRLPLEVRDLFREWLMANFPDRYRHVFKLIRDTRGGKDYDSSFGKRMTGAGPVAWMIGRRFELACGKLGFNKMRTKLTTTHFDPPKRAAEQLSLF